MLGAGSTKIDDPPAATPHACRSESPNLPLNDQKVRQLATGA